MICWLIDRLIGRLLNWVNSFVCLMIALCVCAVVRLLVRQLANSGAALFSHTANSFSYKVVASHCTIQSRTNNLESDVLVVRAFVFLQGS